MNYLGIKTSDNTIEFIKKYKSSSWPLGTVYIQFPGEADPATLLGGTWSNISSSYAGRFFRTPDGYFFRAEGSSAAAFGCTQTANTYVCAIVSLATTGSHTHTVTCSAGGGTCACGGNTTDKCCCSSAATRNTSENAFTHTHSTSISSCFENGETRPYNYTIRIWEKTGW